MILHPDDFRRDLSLPFLCVGSADGKTKTGSPTSNQCISALQVFRSQERIYVVIAERGGERNGSHCAGFRWANVGGEMPVAFDKRKSTRWNAKK